MRGAGGKLLPWATWDLPHCSSVALALVPLLPLDPEDVPLFLAMMKSWRRVTGLTES